MSSVRPERAAPPPSYLRALDDSVAHKLALLAPWLDPLAPGPGGHLVDMGCGSGGLAVALAQRYPGCRVQACDADPAMLAVARQRAAAHPMSWLDVGPADACSAAGAGASAWILSSVLHEVHARGGPSAVRQALARGAQALRPGGRLLVRDFVRPPQAGRALWLLHAVADIEPGHAFDDWAAAAPFPVCLRPGLPAAVPEGFRAYGTDREGAFEYLFRKDSGPAWHAELPQRYGFWTLDEAVQAVAATGLRLLCATVRVNPWVIEHRVQGRVRLQDALTGDPVEPPLTQILLVAEAG